MALPAKRMKRILRVQNLARMRTSVASEGRKVEPVKGVRFVPHDPQRHSTAVVERKNIDREKIRPDRLDTLQVGGKIVAKNPREIPRQKRRLHVKI